MCSQNLPPNEPLIRIPIEDIKIEQDISYSIKQICNWTLYQRGEKIFEVSERPFFMFRWVFFIVFGLKWVKTDNVFDTDFIDVGDKGKITRTDIGDTDTFYIRNNNCVLK